MADQTWGIDPGDITLAGYLYEGNFEQCTYRINAVLRAHGFKQTYILRGQEWAEEPSADQTAGSLKCILGNISAAFLSRIPGSDRCHIFRLVPALRRHAQPFPLQELPAELIKSIYAYALWDSEDAGTNTFRSDGTFGSYCPPLLHVSRGVRAETLPLFFSDFTFAPSVLAFENVKIAKTVCRWAEKVVKDQVKNLRRLNVNVLDVDPVPTARARRYNTGIPPIILSYSPRIGLTVDPPETMVEQSKQLLRTHVASIDNTRKALGLQGEAIIMAITARPELWHADVMCFT